MKSCSVNGWLAVEVPIAVVVNGSTVAVMLATPSDLKDFAAGFLLSEGIVGQAEEIASIDIVEHSTGLEARMWIPTARAAAIALRRRYLAGRPAAACVELKVWKKRPSHLYWWTRGGRGPRPLRSLLPCSS